MDVKWTLKCKNWRSSEDRDVWRQSTEEAKAHGGLQCYRRRMRRRRNSTCYNGLAINEYED
jgi:hypothetical protein